MITFHPTLKGFALAVALIASYSSSAMAQELHAHKQEDDGALVNVVRVATERFKDVNQALREGYAPCSRCLRQYLSAQVECPRQRAGPELSAIRPEVWAAYPNL